MRRLVLSGFGSGYLTPAPGTWGSLVALIPALLLHILGGPIALAMGVPIEPLALLVAVEMLPDIMRTLGNVTMNVAVASAVDRVGSEQA